MNKLGILGLSGLIAGGAWAAAPNQPQTQQPPSQQSQKQSAQQQQQTAQQQPSSGDPKRAMDLAQTAFSSIVSAQAALRNNTDDKTAKQHLTQARKALDTLYGSSEGMQVVKELDKTEGQLAQGTKGVDFAPLTGLVRSRAVFMDPEVVAGVEKAEKQSKEGKAQQAADTLRLARQALVTDLALLPVEDAYSRVVAAEALLNQGQRDDASRLLAGVPLAFAEMEVRTPLVPARFQLRAAAEAAEAKDWKRAETLLDTAATQIQQLQRSAKGTLAKELKPIADDLGKLQKQAEGGKQVSASELRSLAQQTRSLDVG